MESGKIIISGTGCALADFLHNNISFQSMVFRKYLSLTRGDGGLSPGRLVFTEQLEEFFSQPYDKILAEITGSNPPDAFNVGGPSLVSLIHASQLLNQEEFHVRFFGIAKNDNTAHEILKIVSQTPVDVKYYNLTGSLPTPFTDVFSDPTYENGDGERTFVNNIGSAGEFSPDMLNDQFFASHIVCFGGTALVPQIHDHLTELLYKAKKNNCITVVNTVFDFQNEKNNPGKPWPLVKDPEDYNLIDVLVMDSEESFNISGQQDLEKASAYFISSGVSSFFITNGANNIYFWSDGKLFKKTNLSQLPVSKRVKKDIESNAMIKGDTTGCGDNFAGGIIASIARQIQTGVRGRFDLIDAAVWGISSGGFSCYYMGGTYIEKEKGEKLSKVWQIREDYFNEIRNQ